MASTTNSTFTGGCVAPFLDASMFPSTGGYVGARLCMEVLTLPGEPLCCLPCPATDWLYSDSFKTSTTITDWLNVVGLALLLFMLLSYIVLPASTTRRHYLSTCMVLSIILVAIGFIIPLAAQPSECYNEITPNDSQSSIECAFSGAFLVAGGLCTPMWITIRAVSMNLQICWDIVPGRRFLYISQVLGWGIPTALFIATMIVTGVSYRFGNACHVNHQNAMGVFWGPLLAMVGIAIIAQIHTLAYCVRVYFKSFWAADTAGNSTNNSSGLPSYNSSVRGQTARALLQRLKRVLYLQWRGLAIVSIILVDVIFFAFVFIKTDSLAEDAISNFTKTEPWVLCLVANPDNKDNCTALVKEWLVGVETIEAVLYLFACAGFQCFLMLTRPTFFKAWYDVCKRGFVRRREFVSLDAQSHTAAQTDGKVDVLKYEQGHTSAVFEMQTPAGSGVLSNEKSAVAVSAAAAAAAHSTDLALDTKSPVFMSAVSSPQSSYKSPYQPYDGFSPVSAQQNYSPYDDRPGGTSPPVTHPSPPPPSAYVTGLQRDTSDSFRRHNSNERAYNAPQRSFSAARTPSRQSSMSSTRYDGRNTYTRGGLGLHPPVEAVESQEDLGSATHWHD